MHTDSAPAILAGCFLVVTVLLASHNNRAAAAPIFTMVRMTNGPQNKASRLPDSRPEMTSLDDFLQQLSNIRRSRNNRQRRSAVSVSRSDDWPSIIGSVIICTSLNGYRLAIQPGPNGRVYGTSNTHDPNGELTFFLESSSKFLFLSEFLERIVES